jgi:hypothetical protein
VIVAAHDMSRDRRASALIQRSHSDESASQLHDVRPLLSASRASPKTQSDRLRAAVHEAAHACANDYYGYSLISIAIDGCGQSGTGLTKIPRNLYRAPQHVAVIALAGPVAEALHAGVPIDTLWTDVGAADLAMAERALARLPAGRIEADINYAIGAAHAVAYDRRHQIERVARQLVDRGRLGYDDFRALL